MKATRVRALVLAACALVLAATPVTAHHGPQQPANRAAERWPVDAFALTDQHGRPFTQEQLQGHWTFVLFGDLGCGQPCSAGLTAVAGVLRRIARTEAVKTTQLVFVAPGPARADSARRLGDYVARFDSRFIAGTAAVPTLQRLADDLGIAGRVGSADGPDGAAAYPGSLVLIGSTRRCASNTCRPSTCRCSRPTS